MSSQSPAFVTWTQALIARHEASLSFQEVRRGLQALSAQYVQRRLGSRGDPLDGRGKRAAFALYYAPLHYCVVAHVCAAWKLTAPAHIYDWGCGTGVGAAAWAAAGASEAHLADPASLFGCDLNGWALAEARWNWQTLGLRGRAVRGDMARQPVPGAGQAHADKRTQGPRPKHGIVLAFSVNELTDTDRDRLLATLLKAGQQGCQVLIIEPIAKTISPWWPVWQAAFVAAGGGADEHKFVSTLPTALQRYGAAASLDHRRLSARSLFLPARPSA